MKKFTLLLMFIVVSLFTPLISFAEDVVATSPTLLDGLATLLPESVMVWITGIVAVAAALATILPQIQPTSGTAYRIFYNVIQFLGLNFGNAKNEQKK